jgi:hypothetical protein
MSAIAPHRPRRERTEIVRNSAVLAIVAVSTIAFLSSNHAGHPSATAFLAVVGCLALGGLILFAAVSIWRGASGRDSFDQEDLESLREACLQRVIDCHQPGAAAVAVRPVMPAPYAGYLWARVSVEPEPTTDPTAQLVRVRQIHGWAFSRSTAVELAQQKALTTARGDEYWESLNLAEISPGERSLVEVSPIHLS